MDKKYIEEIDEIYASSQYKAHLKQVMLEQQTKTYHLPVFKIAVSLVSCLLLVLFGFSIYYFNSDHNVSFITKHEPSSLIIPNNPSSRHGGLGLGGNLGNDPNLLSHNNPYKIDEDDLLPVYEYHNYDESEYMSDNADEEIITLLKKAADVFNIHDYAIEYLSEDISSFLMNSDIYLKTDYGDLDLLSKYKFRLRLKEPYHIGIKTQEEVEESILFFLEENNLIDIEDTLIDVYITNHVDISNPWRVRISKKTGNEIQGLIENQLHYYEFYIDSFGTLTEIIYFDIDALDKVDDYPIKSIDTALKQLEEGDIAYPYNVQESIDQSDVAYTEIVYDCFDTRKYYMPYYKFYVKYQFDDGSSYYYAYYVCAIQDKYIEFEE